MYNYTILWNDRWINNRINVGFSHKIEKYSSKKFVAFEKPEIPWKYARLFIRDNTMQIWSEHTFVI